MVVFSECFIAERFNCAGTRLCDLFRGDVLLDGSEWISLFLAMDKTRFKRERGREMVMKEAVEGPGLFMV